MPTEDIIPINNKDREGVFRTIDVLQFNYKQRALFSAFMDRIKGAQPLVRESMKRAYAEALDNDAMILDECTVGSILGK